MKTITITLTECDIELFKELLDGEEDTIEWSFYPDESNIMDVDEIIKVKFKREDND